MSKKPKRRLECAGWNVKRVTTHPAEMLQEEFMLPLSIGQNKLASDLRVPRGRINQIINGKRSITSDTALRLAKYFGNSPEFWMNLQQMYDLSKTRAESGERIEREVRVAKRDVDPRRADRGGSTAQYFR